MARKTSTSGKGRSKTASRGTGKRALIAPKNDKRFVRRSGAGRFKESDDQGRSLATDGRRHARTKTKSGYGDRGDRA